MKVEAPPVFVAPERVRFQLGEQDVTVTAANIAQLGLMLQQLGPLLRELAELPDTLARLASQAGATHEDVLLLLTLLSEHPGLAEGFVAAATGMPLAAIGQLMPDAFAYLFAVVVQLNADFFGRALPVFLAAGARLGAIAEMRMAQAAKTPGPSSSTS